MNEFISHVKGILREVDSANVEEVAEGNRKIVNFVSLEAIFEIQSSESVRRTV